MHDGIDNARVGIHVVRQAGISHQRASGNVLETLERRLHDGYLRIEQAKGRGEDVVAWEEFWIELLHQYEEAYDALPEAA
jgi:hypothetical protein